MALRKGTSVEWNTPQGPTHGKIVEKKTSDFDLDGNKHRASEEAPVRGGVREDRCTRSPQGIRPDREGLGPCPRGSTTTS
ncbi:hypothetical protein JOE40_002207 [Arthrobacter sp. PvP102]|nr:hypothetical protein [Arthrobacter sp. PvP103]MBP1237698.1 hypothetical protein [Arthrobacter sp. PvP102]